VAVGFVAGHEFNGEVEAADQELVEGHVAAEGVDAIGAVKVRTVRSREVPEKSGCWLAREARRRSLRMTWSGGG
jgi:hypothetical protein